LVVGGAGFYVEKRKGIRGMKKIWVNKAASFKEAEKFDEEYYRAMSEIERLEIVQFLRETHYKLDGGKNEDRKGLRGFVKIIQRAQG